MTGILRVTQRLKLAHEKIVVVVFAIEHRRIFTAAVGGTAHRGVVGFPGKGKLRDAQRITEIAGGAAERLCSTSRFALARSLSRTAGSLSARWRSAVRVSCRSMDRRLAFSYISRSRMFMPRLVSLL